jgi:hypothetical protein
LALVVFPDTAIIALTASYGYQGIHDEIAGFDVSDALPNFFHIAGGFVPGDGREGARPMFALYHMNIAVTDRSGRAANGDLAFARRL